jgi:hypothetical protein
LLKWPVHTPPPPQKKRKRRKQMEKLPFEEEMLLELRNSFKRFKRKI